MAAFAIRTLLANGGFQLRPMTAEGTQEASNQADVERQVSVWTGHWVCRCQQAGISLNLPLTWDVSR